MTAEARKILEQALALPEEARAVVLEGLAQSLQPDEDDLHPDWDDEILRRVKSIESGESKLTPWKELEAELRDSIKR